ncbi:hypothetical protein HRI_001795400 [Hibiscus trionum]|uniref:BHLH domain-containing protein n=1 Tax=Hibiscus trionum TaxID=183268 RepID=A0A9W7LYT8_HIBTR|nr:hypothetical protein HRI_001795400 [Hibiscus trionum]
MNRGLLQSSPVQQLMAGNPNCWNNNHELPESWSQLLLGGLVEDEENSASSYVYGNATKPAWFHQISSSASSPKSSSVTSFSSNMLDFSGNKADHPSHPPPVRSSEVREGTKKARVQPSATQSTLKVRKEKLGDRITSLHQLVSPFGKTDTASVLSEAIGYIRFLQSQIEALSLPYLGNGSANMRHQQSDCKEEANKDLRSRGLCLVPVSCTLEVWSGDNGADYWAPPPALGAGFFR